MNGVYCRMFRAIILGLLIGAIALAAMAQDM
jgi:hypothetical protein